MCSYNLTTDFTFIIGRSATSGGICTLYSYCLVRLPNTSLKFNQFAGLFRVEYHNRLRHCASFFAVWVYSMNFQTPFSYFLGSYSLFTEVLSDCYLPPNATT